MSRSENIVHAHLFHITWEDDCLAFRFAKSKTDQTGRNSDQVWHVYATPDKPAMFARRGSWDVGSAVRLFESVHHFFDYPSKIKRWMAQISWQTVFNLFRANGRRFATDIE